MVLQKKFKNKKIGISFQSQDKDNNFVQKRQIKRLKKMKSQQVKYTTFCSHNYQKSLTNTIELKCLDQQNFIHVISQVGKICNKCSELLTKSLQTRKKCLVCAQQIQEYLKQKQICPHENQQYDEAAINCQNNPKQMHYIPLKGKVCKICLNKITASFNMSDECKVCEGKENQIFEDIEKNIISPIFFSIRNIINYLSEKKADEEIFKKQVEYFCKAEKRPEYTSTVPKEICSDDTQNHLSKRYSLYPKCVKHRNQPIQLCNKCLVGVLNLENCPYGCQYVKEKKQKIKNANEYVQTSETGFLCMYPQPLEDSYYLDLFVVRQIQEKGRLDRWESFLKKVRPLDSTTSKCKNYFGLYAGSALIGNNMYLNCGGVIGNSIHTKDPINYSFLLRLTQDLKNFQIRQTEPMNQKRASHTLVFHQQFYVVYAIGGFIKGQGCLRSCEFYDINNNQWRQMSPLIVERSKPTSFIYQNNLYVFGGMTVNPKIGQVFAQKYNRDRNQWQPLHFQGFDYPSLTGAISLTSLPSYQNKQALWMIGGSNYQDYSTLIQNLEIKEKSFSLNLDTYLTVNHPRCNATLGLINDDIVIVFGGLKQHQSLLSIQAIKIRTIKDFSQPMFTYEEIQLGSYRLLLRESAEHAYTKLYQNLQQQDILSKNKLNKQDQSITNIYNSHMFEKMFYTIGKNFVWVSIETKK